MKVVLVDDSEAIRRSFGDLLEDVPGVELAGCAVDIAGACALIDASRPDVVVLDLELRGGERGIEVLKHAARRHPRTQVIVLSNSDGQRVRDELRAAGAQEHFYKSSEFLRVRDWIAARAAAQVEPGPTEEQPRRS